MIQYRRYNIIVPLFRIEEKISGGIPAFQLLLKQFTAGEMQTDDYMISIAADNATEVGRITETLIGMGLDFNDATDSSDDFAVVAREGLWWDTPWLISNDDGCWFIADVQAPA